MKPSMMLALKKFRKSQDGGMAIEYVIMVPLFVAMISGAVDLSRVFVDQSNFYSTARDTARLVARHAMDETAAESYATTRMAQMTSAATVSDVTIGSNSVTLTITAPVTALAKFQFLDWLNTLNMSASVTHALEPT